jgi:hypothetical protein
MKYRMFGQAVSKIHDCFGLCNVMTEFDPPFERLFYEDFNGGFHFKGGGWILVEIFTSEAIEWKIWNVSPNDKEF